MIEKLEGRDKVNAHKIANKLNEVIEILNYTEPTEEEKQKHENN